MHKRWPLYVAIAVFCTACTKAVEVEQVQAALRGTLGASARPAYVTRDAEGKKLWQLTRQFYEEREYAPAWVAGTKPRPQMNDLISTLSAASLDGLDPDLYNVSLLQERYTSANQGFLTARGFDPSEAGAFDVWLTHSYLKFASDLADGLSDLSHADRTWQIRQEKFDPVAHLDAALKDNRIKASLLELTPRHSHYESLREALAEHRAQAANGGWPRVPPRLRLKPGQKSPHVGILARRLAASGDYRGRLPAEGEPVVFGPELQEAVRRFQQRHGLQDDGVVGGTTVAELNVPLERRLQQIELNLERWRWLPRDLGERHIFVNIPEYHLELREGGRVPLTMRVVVGKTETPTPIFNGEISYLVFSPYWNVPPGIAEGETLPAILQDPAFLERNNMEVIDTSGNVVDAASLDLEDPTRYRFRQRPGKHNSLGLVKFMFPNQHHVYLHDTPVDSLFQRATRSFSHGCVRVQEPRALAEYLLRDQRDWTADRIEQAMHGGEERIVKLREPIPVYLGYWTARVAADGRVQFLRDIYNIDTRQTALLKDRLARLRKSAAAARAAADQGGATATPPSGRNTD